MIYDLSLGFNELDFFRIRYNELKDIVDKFVIVEATHTHRGEPKFFYFSDWFNTNAIVEDGIDPSKVEIILWDNGPSFCPTTPEYAWVRENFQREVLGIWVLKHCASNDLVMLSDMDEIPKGTALQEWLDGVNEQIINPNGVWRFEQDLTYLYFNTLAGKWNGTKIFPAHMLTEMRSDKPMTDLVRYRPENLIAGTIKDGGWHFSSCFGLERVRLKFDSYAHTELSAKTNEDIQDSLDRKVDPFHKNPMTVVDCNFLPNYVLNNITYFRDKGCIADVD